MLYSYGNQTIGFKKQNIFIDFLSQCDRILNPRNSAPNKNQMCCYRLPATTRAFKTIHKAENRSTSTSINQTN